MKLSEQLPVLGAALLGTLAGAGLVAEAAWNRSAGGGRWIGDHLYTEGRAERKPRGHPLWQSLQETQLMYYRDTVHTQGGSRTALRLRSDALVALDELTMVILSVEDGRDGVELLQGSVLVRAGKNPLDLIADGRRTIVGPGKQGSFRRTVQGIEPREQLRFAVRAPRPIAPHAEATFEFRTERPLVHLSWQGRGMYGNYRLVVGHDPQLRSPVMERVTTVPSVHISLQGGDYYWKVRSEIGGSQSEGPVGRFHVRENKALVALDPFRPAERDVVLVAGLKEKGVLFAWRRIPEVVKSVFRLAADSGFEKVIITHESYLNHYLLQRAIPEGSYHWKVDGFDRGGRHLGTSTVSRFDLRARMPEPDTAFPADGSVVDMSPRDSLPFRWPAVAGAVNYRFRLLRGGKTVADGNAVRAAHSITDLRRLDVGSYEWLIEAVAADGHLIDSRRRSFRIVLSDDMHKDIRMKYE